MRGIPFEAVPYDREKHAAFVLDSWIKGARRKRNELGDLLRSPSVRCLVAHVPGESDALLGWAAVAKWRECEGGAGTDVIWAYTSKLFRRRGLATSLLYRLGVDVSEPTPVRFWSPVASAIASGGHYRIYYQEARSGR